MPNVKNTSKSPCEPVLFVQGPNGLRKERRRWLPGQDRVVSKEEMEAIYRSTPAGKAMVDKGVLTGWSPSDQARREAESAARAQEAERKRRHEEAKARARAEIEERELARAEAQAKAEAEAEAREAARAKVEAAEETKAKSNEQEASGSSGK